MRPGRTSRWVPSATLAPPRPGSGERAHGAHDVPHADRRAAGGTTNDRNRRDITAPELASRGCYPPRRGPRSRAESTTPTFVVDGARHRAVKADPVSAASRNRRSARPRRLLLWAHRSAGWRRSYPTARACSCLSPALRRSSGAPSELPTVVIAPCCAVSTLAHRARDPALPMRPRDVAIWKTAASASSRCPPAIVR